MDKLIYLNELFDMYQELLTEKQQMYFKDYSPIPFSISTLAVPQQVLFLIQSLKEYLKIDLYFFILNFNIFQT